MSSAVLTVKNDYNKLLNDTERTLNVFGSIPLVAMISSFARGFFAGLQTVAAGGIGLTGLIVTVIGHLEKGERLLTNALNLWIHSKGNGQRAAVEFIFGLTIVGSLGLAIYQYKKGINPIYITYDKYPVSQ